MTAQYSTQNDLLLTNLLDFYNDETKLDTMLSIINGESKISLRIVDWFATNYAKKYNTLYTIKGETDATSRRFKVYIDPYAGANYLVVGYKGTNAFDAGIFYCPYVPLQMVRAVGENSFQSKIGFKTRYGLVANPMAKDDGAIAINTNIYYRRVHVTNLL